MSDQPIKTVTEANIGQIAYLVERIGITAIVCAFLGYMLHVKMERLGFKVDRCIRNERAIMQKLEIPIIVQEDKWDQDK